MRVKLLKDLAGVTGHALYPNTSIPKFNQSFPCEHVLSTAILLLNMPSPRVFAYTIHLTLMMTQ